MDIEYLQICYPNKDNSYKLFGMEMYLMLLDTKRLYSSVQYINIIEATKAWTFNK